MLARPSVALTLVVLGACSTVAQPDRMVQRTSESEVSNRAIRAAVADFRRALVLSASDVAMDIVAQSDDHATRESGLLFVSMLSRESARAARLADGVVALVDIWTLTAQLADYYANGDGKAALGGREDELVGTLREFEGEAIGLVDSIGDPALSTSSREIVTDWVARWPIRGRRLVRISTFPLFSRLDRSQAASVFQSVRTIEETLERVDDVVGDLPYVATQMLTIQTALLVEHYLARLDDAGFGTMLADAARTLTDLPAWLDGERDTVLAAVTAERQAAMEDLERQRLETIAVLQDERRALVAAVDSVRDRTLGTVHDERVATMEQVEQLQVATLERIDALADRSTDRVAATAAELLDRASWRALGAAAVGALGLVIAAGIVARRR